MLGIVFALVGMLFLFLAAFCFFLYRDLENGGDTVGKATASLTEVKTKKNVRTKTSVIKNFSTGKYEYKVNGKTYVITHDSAVTARQMPYIVPVVYLKIMPSLACVKRMDSLNPFIIYAIVCALLALEFIFFGIMLMA